MSSADANDTRITVNVKKMPRFILRKDKMTILKPAGNSSELLKTLKTFSKPLYKEDIIYQSVSGDFLRLVDHKVTIVNKQNLATKSSVTVARYEESGRVFKETTSENITNLIGKDNYELVFSTLCSVINQEFKIRGILALLTLPKKSDGSSCERCESGDPPQVNKAMTNIAIQTEESSFDMMIKPTPQRRVKRQHPTPYVVTDVQQKVNKIVISPTEFKNFNSYDEVSLKTEPLQIVKTEPVSPYKSVQISEPVSCGTDNDLPVLHIEEENSRESFGGFSQFSYKTTDELMKSPYTILNNIDKVTERAPEQLDWANSSSLTMLDGTVIQIPVKPEDVFHVATPDILTKVEPEHRRKLLCYQLYMDWKYCLTRNEDDYLPLHTAVENDDVDLVRRQCLVLKSKRGEGAVDATTADSQTALQISITRGTAQCTSMLLRFGADPLATDDEYRTCFHLAAEAAPGHLEVMIAHCRSDPMKILQENEELWKPELASKPKEYQASWLLREICGIADNQGDTPLMVACRLGRHENVKLLLEAAPNTVNVPMPSSGNTALYRAVEAAFHDSTNRGNKSKISDDFKNTIEVLVEYGADPTIDNYSGFNVNTLLTDFSIGELAQLIAAKLSYRNTKDSRTVGYNPLMLVKEEDGTYNVVDLKNNKKNQVKNTRKVTKDKNNAKSPKAVQNTYKGVNKTMKAAIESTEHNINMIIQNDQAKNTPKNTVSLKNTTEITNLNQNKPSESKKFVILEDKIIKTVKPKSTIVSKPKETANKNQNIPNSNQYMNSFKQFVHSGGVVQGSVIAPSKNNALKRTAIPSKIEEMPPKVVQMKPFKVAPKLVQIDLSKVKKESDRTVKSVEIANTGQIAIEVPPPKKKKITDEIESQPSTSSV